MKPEEQRVAIAKFCGACDLLGQSAYWPKHCQPLLYNTKTSFAFSSERPGFLLGGIPDFCNDLNAIHKAWHELGTREQRVDFSQHLRNCIVYKGMSCYEEGIVALCQNATAAQRCEALLKTIGKWKDE